MTTPTLILQPIAPVLLQHPKFEEAGISVWALRLDQIHPLVSGNKWLKLSGWIEKSGGIQQLRGIMTQGGPWSNHLHAAAAFCHLNGHRFTAIVGSHPNQQTAMLQDIANWGGQIVWANHQAFRNEQHWQQQAADEGLLWVPMGGDGEAGEAGVKSYFDQFAEFHFDEIWCARGTGTTIRGILGSKISFTKMISFNPGLRDVAIDQQLLSLANASCKALETVQLTNDRFGKHTNTILHDMNEWFQLTGMPTDGVYTGKMVSCLLQRLKQGNQPAPSSLLLVHTGGLQGNRSLPPGTLKFMG